VMDKFGKTRARFAAGTQICRHGSDYTAVKTQQRRVFTRNAGKSAVGLILFYPFLCSFA
jgi:hypothetical protein